MNMVYTAATHVRFYMLTAVPTQSIPRRPNIVEEQVRIFITKRSFTVICCILAVVAQNEILVDENSKKPKNVLTLNGLYITGLVV